MTSSLHSLKDACCDVLSCIQLSFVYTLLLPVTLNSKYLAAWTTIITLEHNAGGALQSINASQLPKELSAKVV